MFLPQVPAQIALRHFRLCRHGRPIFVSVSEGRGTLPAPALVPRQHGAARPAFHRTERGAALRNTPQGSAAPPSGGRYGRCTNGGWSAPRVGKVRAMPSPVRAAHARLRGGGRARRAAAGGRALAAGCDDITAAGRARAGRSGATESVSAPRRGGGARRRRAARGAVARQDGGGPALPSRPAAPGPGRCS